MMPFVLLEYLLGRPELHDFPGIHDAHTVTGLGHNPKVMGNEQHGGIELLLEFPNHLQYLRLDGDVKSRSGLVSQEELWFTRERDCDNNSLFHAA
jgi:hypothetical protein